MIQKILPKNGKVLIIDDKPEDVIPIQNILAENGIPYIFYDYTNLKEYNVNKLDAVRMLFLDIRLEDGIQGTKNIATVLASTIEKVVKCKNGPYTIVLWTNEIALKDEIQEYLLSNLSAEETTLPTYVCALDKKDFELQPKDTLENSLLSQLKGQHMMNFLIEWENYSMGISGNIIRLLLYGLQNDMDDKSIENILIQMACLENSEVNTKEQATKNVLHALVELVKDRYLEIVSNEEVVAELSNYWEFDFEKKDEIKNIHDNIPIEQRASINTFLNLNTYDTAGAKLPGKVFSLSESDLVFNVDDFRDSTLSNNWFKNNEMRTHGEVLNLTLQAVEVDITPNCDYAQNKNHMLRTIFGYMIKIGQVSKDGKNVWINEKYSKKINHTIKYEYVYVTPEFLLNDEIYVLALNTKYMTLENKNYCQNYRYLFRFNNDILGEIRKRGADMIARIGINNF